MSKVYLNMYGQPRFTPEQLAFVHAELISRPCPVPTCLAGVGEDCKGTKNVHMGRLPNGFDSVILVEQEHV